MGLHPKHRNPEAQNRPMNQVVTFFILLLFWLLLPDEER